MNGRSTPRAGYLSKYKFQLDANGNSRRESPPRDSGQPSSSDEEMLLRYRNSVGMKKRLSQGIAVPQSSQVHAEAKPQVISPNSPHHPKLSNRTNDASYTPTEDHGTPGSLQNDRKINRTTEVAQSPVESRAKQSNLNDSRKTIAESPTPVMQPSRQRKQEQREQHPKQTQQLRQQDTDSLTAASPVSFDRLWDQVSPATSPQFVHMLRARQVSPDTSSAFSFDNTRAKRETDSQALGKMENRTSTPSNERPQQQQQQQQQQQRQEPQQQQIVTLYSAPFRAKPQQQNLNQSMDSQNTISESSHDTAFERFIMAPPRISDPTPLVVVPQRQTAIGRLSTKLNMIAEKREREASGERVSVDDRSLPFDEPRTVTSSAIVPVPTSSANSSLPPDDEDSLFDFQDQTKQSPPDIPTLTASPPRESHPPTTSPSSSPYRKSSLRNSRWRTRRPLGSENESNSPGYKSTVLSRVPEAAWLKPTTGSAPVTRKAKNNVYFREEDNSVHHFVAESSYSDETSAYSGSYSSGLEPNVDDAIDDILKLKTPQSTSGQTNGGGTVEKKRRVAPNTVSTGMYDDDYESSAVTDGDTTLSASRTTDHQNSSASRNELSAFTGSTTEQSRDQRIHEIQEEDLFFEQMIKYVENGVGAMASGLGLAGSPDEANEEIDQTRGSSHPSSSDLEDRHKSRVSRAPSKHLAGKESSRDKKTSKSKEALRREDLRSRDGLIDEESRSYSKRAASRKSSRGAGRSSRHEEAEEPEDEQKADAALDNGGLTLDTDPRLVELATQAAHCVHQMLGVQFDRSQEVDIRKDIRFSIAKLTLPLGIIFQEDDGGCWATKVLPNGNAALHGGVDAGDQLAAINGVSAVKMGVDGICAAISQAHDHDGVELTFLRYIGEFKPAQVEERRVVTERLHLSPVKSSETNPENGSSAAKPPASASAISLAKSSTEGPMLHPEIQQTNGTGEAKKKKKFKWFKRSKGRATKSE